MKRLQKFGIVAGMLVLLLLIVGSPRRQSLVLSPTDCNASELPIVGSSNQGLTAKDLCPATGVVCPYVGARAMEWTKVKLTWHTHIDVDQIRIFRYGADGARKVATLKGGAEAYMDTVEPAEEYTYEIVAYRKKGKKYKRIAGSGSQSCVAFSGMEKIVWDEYADCEAVTTPESIMLPFAVQGGVRPNGFEIFRSADGEKFEHIKTLNKRQWWLQYTDRTVQGHQTYYYKVRAFWKNYKKNPKKKKYSAFTDVMKYTAINSDAGYSVKVLTEEGDALPSLTVCLTGDAGNGDFAFIGHSWGRFDNETISISVFMEYSYDGENWFSFEEDNAVLLKAGQRMYLRFTGVDGGKLFYKKGQEAVIRDIFGSYNNLSYRLSIDLGKLTAVADLDGEFYH